jgi:RsiW-degrading membrane proteinase PrsW (M82 family)
LNAVFTSINVFSTIVWAFVPPLAVLLLYYRRVRAAPPLVGLLLLFGVGILAGLCALGLEKLVQLIMRPLQEWPVAPTPLIGLMLQQLGITAPIEEGCKLAGVAIPLIILIRRYQKLPAQPSTVLLATFAVAMGFAAQESTIAIWQNHSLMINRSIAAPLHAIFSAPWGLALGFALARLLRHSQYAYKLIMRAWITACLAHAGSNSWVYLTQSAQNVWLMYPLCSWWLWLWWQTEIMLARSQGDPAPKIITATTLPQRFWEFFAALLLLGLGGAALNAVKDLGNGMTFLWMLRNIFDQTAALFIAQELLRTVLLSTATLWLFRYMRDRADRPTQ